VRAGDSVGVHYDPLIAKLIVWGADRREATARLVQALAATDAGPLVSNLPSLRALAAHPAWLAAEVDTGFIARHADSLKPAHMPRDDALAAAAAYLLSAPVAHDAGPWERLRGFRLNLPHHERLRLGLGEDAVDVVARREAGGIHLTVDGETLQVDSPRQGPGATVSFTRAGRERRVRVHTHGETLHLDDGAARASVTRLPPATPAGGAQVHGAGQLVAPMPGRVVSLAVAAGDRVTAGQALVVLEAMKMEHTLTAPAEGEVTSVGCTAGEQVDEGMVLITLELD
jgi:3-methylcrotonyl-CoA carboxylase alpha subunit